MFQAILDASSDLIDPSLFVKLIMMSLSSLYMFSASVKENTDCYHIGRFIQEFIRLIVNRININLSNQLESGIPYNEVVHHGETFLYMEPYLPTVKMILFTVSSPVMRQLESLFDTGRTMQLISSCCTKICQFRKQLYPHQGFRDDVLFLEDSSLIGFLPIKNPLLDTYKVAQIPLDDVMQVTIRLDQIKTIALSLCSVQVQQS